jgi:hypothetical protein
MRKYLLSSLLIIICSCPAIAAVPVTGVSLDKGVVTITIGGLFDYPVAELPVTILPADATNKNLTWNSSNEAVARVSAFPFAFVTGRSPGTSTITVTTEDGGYKSTCIVEVIPSDTDVQIANVRYSSNVSEAAAKTAGFSEGDFELVNGVVTIKKSITESIAKKLLGADNIEIIPVPWFEAVNWNSGKLAAICNHVSNTMFIEELKNFTEVEELLILNVLSPESGEFMKQADKLLMNIEDGDYCYRFVSIVPMSTIPENVYLTVFIRDGGRLDLDKTRNASVVGQIAIVAKGKLKKDPDPIVDPEPSKGSSGGCVAIYGSILLLSVSLVYCLCGRQKK